MRIAMFVADTWDYTYPRNIRTTTEQPPYKWYYLGLATARETFKEMITDDDIDGTAIPYVARDELKNLHVVNLWNTLWGEATGFCESGGDAQSRLRYHMYAWILQKLSDMDQPETPELEALRAIILREFRCPRFEDLSDEERGQLGDFRAPNCNVYLDLEWMEWVRARRILRQWGRRFYGDALPQGFSTDAIPRTNRSSGPIRVDENGDVPEELLRDIYLSADLEAYGPLINPLNHATVEINRPNDQDCTICAYGYPSTITVEQCVRIRLANNQPGLTSLISLTAKSQSGQSQAGGFLFC
jgi:hypothetical protein